MYTPDMCLDGKHVPSQVSLKFASRWFGPFRMLAARGPVVQLDLPATLCLIMLVTKRDRWESTSQGRVMCEHY